MTVTDFMCTKCQKLCDAIEEVCVDREPYGDQMVERTTYEYWSVCCRVEVEFLEADEVLH